MSLKHFYTEFPSPIGTLQLRGTEAAVHGLFMEGHSNRPPLGSGATRDESPLRSAMEQIEEFLSGARRCFDLPIALDGTPFQLSVWRELLRIPYGATRTYGAIAACIFNRRAARAVGAANRCNPLSILVPCHRVIAAGGAIGGYGGGVARKQFLLALERRMERAGTAKASVHSAGGNTA
jgi:methylated-DNA-[protein]-cysteine S-methyltransferase